MAMSRLLSLARPDGALVYAATKSVDLLENRCEWAHALPSLLAALLGHVTQGVGRASAGHP